MIKMNAKQYKDKVDACWLGKNIGGTLGAPYEWIRQINDVTFYAQDPGGSPLPNDDLDIQLLWLIMLEDIDSEPDSRLMSEYWVKYVTPYWCEYGTAKANLSAKLLPPLSGTHQNPFKDSCGAYIRSEIWACVAPGNPALAVRYALEDAMIDHGFGEGTYAEIFCAAIESAAFVESNIHTLIDIGLSYIPEGCGVAGAVGLVLKMWQEKKRYLEVREALLENYRGQSYYGRTSQRDMEKGFHNGQDGYDAPSNIGIVIIGLLYGEGDFGNSLCYAVNCGEDTDCTAATIGSIFGIIHGTAGIEEKWTKPIGRSIQTMCLNIGELGAFQSRVPSSIDHLTSRVYAICERISKKYNKGFVLTDSSETLVDIQSESLKGQKDNSVIYKHKDRVHHKFTAFDVYVDLGGDCEIASNTPKKIKLYIQNNRGIPEMLDVKIWKDETVSVNGPVSGKLNAGVRRTGCMVTVFEFEISTQICGSVDLVVQLTPSTLANSMLVPITLLGKLSQTVDEWHVDKKSVDRS